MTLRSVEGCCKKLMLANVLQLISFLSVLFAATIAAFLGVYRYYITLIFWTAIALTLNSAMLLCAHSIKKRLPTTPFAIKLQQSRPDEIVQALEVKPVIPNAYYNFRKIGRKNVRLLVLLANGSEGKNLKKRANSEINKQTKYRGEQPLFEAFKMLRLNLTIMECQNQKGSTIPKDSLYCSCGRAEMVLNMSIFMQDHRLLIPPLPKHAELHEIRRYRAALRMLKNALSIER